MRLREHATASAEICRAETNRRNSQHSTGPRTAEGKSCSSQNAFKHGLHSKKFIFPDECAAEFDQLRATLRCEHQPANTTEEILCDELAQHFWRMRRYREMEASAWQPDSKLFTPAILALLARLLGAAEHGFYRSLAALTKLQKARGFVPSKMQTASGAASLPQPTAEHDSETNGHNAAPNDTDSLRPASSAQPPQPMGRTPSCPLPATQPSHQPSSFEMASFLK